MISVEKRRANKLKQIRARDSSEHLRDMIVGNKATPVLLDPEDANTPLSDDFPSTSITDAQATQIPTGGKAGGVESTTGGVESTTILGSPVSTTTVGDGTTQTPDSTLEPANDSGKGQDTSSSGSSGLAMGAKIGIGIAVPLVFIFIGVAAFFFFRRKKQRRQTEKGEVGEVMIIGGKHHVEEDQSTAGSPSYGHSASAPGAQATDGNMYTPTTMQDHTAGYDQQVGPSGGAVVVAPVPRRTQQDDEDLMNRPVSPVHDDDLLAGPGDARSTHSGTRSGTALGGSARDRASPSLDDDDREMQWILEEERKAKERREQQGRLPTHP